MSKKKDIILTDQKGPDEYRCIKLALSKVIVNTKFIKDIFDCVVRANKITIKTYQLLRLFVLDKLQNNQEVPVITKDIIKMAQKSILKKGRSPKGDNLIIFNAFTKLYKFDPENGLHLSQVLHYTATTMLTMIENNIKMRFFNYVRRFINSYFRHKYNEEIKDKDFRKTLNKELSKLKSDIINNTKECDSKYHAWLDENRHHIVPRDYKKSYHYDIQCKPQKYLKNMHWMCLQLENLEVKMFQFMPLQTDIIPKAIPLDTKTLIELFISNKTQYLNDIEGSKEFVWNSLFKLNIKMKNYLFDHCIVTDGYSVSLRYVHHVKAEEEKRRKDNMKKARQVCKGLTKEQKIALKQKKEANRKKKSKTNKTKRDSPQKKYVDFLYIDEVDKDQLEGHHVYVDPGKKSIFYMMDNNEKTLDYTNKRRIRETKRLKYQKLMKNYRDKIGITEVENTLIDYNSKTCKSGKFKEYMKQKNKINSMLFTKYNNTRFRQYKWYAYINKKRSEDNMLNLIEKTYGKDAVIIIGDASLGKSMRGLLSAPNVALKRKLKQRFRVYHIDEFRTSCLHHKTEEKGDNLYYKDTKKMEVLKRKLNGKIKDEKEKHYIEQYVKKGIHKSRKLHSVLTFKMENGRLGCINRDKNACFNIKKLFKSFIEKGERPLRYRRGYNIKKGSNPSLEAPNGSHASK